MQAGHRGTPLHRDARHSLATLPPPSLLTRKQYPRRAPRYVVDTGNKDAVFEWDDDGRGDKVASNFEDFLEKVRAAH